VTKAKLQSSKRPKDAGLSFAHGLFYLERFAAERGWIITQIYKDASAIRAELIMMHVS
jgi:hypothetical protein